MNTFRMKRPSIGPTSYTSNQSYQHNNFFSYKNTQLERCVIEIDIVHLIHFFVGFYMYGIESGLGLGLSFLLMEWMNDLKWNEWMKTHIIIDWINQKKKKTRRKQEDLLFLFFISLFLSFVCFFTSFRDINNHFFVHYSLFFVEGLNISFFSFIFI